MQAEAASWSATLVQLTVEKKTILEYLLDSLSRKSNMILLSTGDFSQMINHIILWKNKFWYVHLIWTSCFNDIFFLNGKDKILAAIQFWLPISTFSRFLSSIYQITILEVLHFQIENHRWNLFKQFLFIGKSHLRRIPIRIVNGDIYVDLEHFFFALNPG